MQAKSPGNITVIDVSHWQGVIDWNAVAADGIRGAIIKATQGTRSVDEQFKTNAIGAAKAGLFTGFYHYAHPELNDPKYEAAHFSATVKAYPSILPLALDVEGSAANKGAKQLTEWCLTFLQELEHLSGRATMIYTGASFAKSYLGSNLRPWPLWIAHYGVNKPMNNPTWNSWSIFQYTSSGRVKGIVGNVDMNVMERDFFEGLSNRAGEVKRDMKAEDANKIIPFLQAAWKAAMTDADKAEYNRLANELRKASGQPTQ